MLKSLIIVLIVIFSLSYNSHGKAIESSEITSSDAKSNKIEPFPIPCGLDCFGAHLTEESPIVRRDCASKCKKCKKCKHCKCDAWLNHKLFASSEECKKCKCDDEKSFEKSFSAENKIKDVFEWPDLFVWPKKVEEIKKVEKVVKKVPRTVKEKDFFVDLKKIIPFDKFKFPDFDFVKKIIPEIDFPKFESMLKFDFIKKMFPEIDLLKLETILKFDFIKKMFPEIDLLKLEKLFKLGKIDIDEAVKCCKIYKDKKEKLHEEKWECLKKALKFL